MVGSWTTCAVPGDTTAGGDASSIDALLGRVGAGAREMVAAATQAVLRRFGDRGSFILLSDGAHVVFSTAAPQLTDLAIDLRRYPEVGAALARHEVVVVEDVRTSALLQPVAAHLPPTLGAVAAVPMMAGDQCLGVILAQSASCRTMAADDLAAARLEARLAGTLLHLQFGAALGNDLLRLGPAALAPVATPIDTTRAAPSSSVAPAPATRGCILIGEDDRDQAEAMSVVLGDEGFEAVVARDGSEVLRLARQLQPDLILLDVQMPVLSGFDALAELVRDVRTCDIPILIVSGAEDLLTRVRALKVDTVDFLRKPFSLMELLARVDRSLSQAVARGHLRLEASIDDLTGLGNPRYLREQLALEQSRIARYGTHSAIVMVDVDKLKQVNDRHGHVVGSSILRALGDILRSQIRETDLAARYGGDEFVVLLPHTTAAEACAFAGRVLACVRRARPEGIEVSISLGVAALEGSNGQSIDSLLAEADAAAYRAKRAGGGRVCVYDKTLDVMDGARDHQRGATGS